MYTLLLRLGGPLQSWGSGSMFDRRDTDSFPTKSGVLGIVAAALGRKRGMNMDDLASLQFGIRIDYPGERVVDFQITDMGEKLNSNLSYRYYLSDAVFLAGLESSSYSVIREIEEALLNPVYAPFLGRRSCPPSMPFVLGIREKDLYSALYEEAWQMPAWRQKSILRFKQEIRLRILMDDKEVGQLKRDVPVSYSPFKREYTYRKVSEKKPRIIVSEECFAESADAQSRTDQTAADVLNQNGIVATDHDAMAELR